ncbi:heavy metal-binding domain-containing protein [Actinophytocola sp.]|jgi:uncharacterized protein YbjQ (UPF0145 family)|uniref:heavy metal-binding domain-containing protein n=1 Tax=Actinophytocola sp. TaxID=1872138 RepID=UPI002EDA6CAF
MTGWNGTGLPPVAAQRVQRAAQGGPWTSLLSVPAAAGLRVAGLEPAGEVMGSMVQQISLVGASCGTYWPGPGGWVAGGPVAAPLGPRGFGPYLDALNLGYATALDRMTQEATALGADGIVGITLATVPLGGAVEFTALGTAVRAPGHQRPGRVFTTALSGQDVAKLMTAGWVPAVLVYGISVAVRHDDWQSRAQASWGAGNVEVDGYTQLIGHTRADARARLARQTRATGADGAIVSSMGLRLWSVEPSERHRDHVAEATVFGTAIARFATTATPAAGRPLTILPLHHTPSGSTS